MGAPMGNTFVDLTYRGLPGPSIGNHSSRDDSRPTRTWAPRDELPEAGFTCTALPPRSGGLGTLTVRAYASISR